MAKARRKPPNLREKLASALLHMPQIGPDFRPVLDGMGRLVPMFSIDEVRAMTADNFASLWQFDHAIYATWLGNDERHPWWNYTPRLILPHKEKTKRDRKNIDKVKRAQRKAVKRAVALLEPIVADKPPRARKPKRLMQYTAMKDTHKRTFGGKTVERRAT